MTPSRDAVIPSEDGVFIIRMGDARIVVITEHFVFIVTHCVRLAVSATRFIGLVSQEGNMKDFTAVLQNDSEEQAPNCVIAYETAKQPIIALAPTKIITFYSRNHPLAIALFVCFGSRDETADAVTNSVTSGVFYSLGNEVL